MTIGINGAVTEYDFEPESIPVSTPETLLLLAATLLVAGTMKLRG